MKKLTSAPLKPTRSETRAPSSTRAKTSRPFTSVPKKCRALGGANCFELVARGSTPWMNGPKIAVAAMNRRTANAMMATGFFRRRRHAPGGAATGLLIELDAPIEPGVGDIDEEIQNDEQTAINNEHAAAKKDIAIENRVDEIATHPGDVEDRFHNDRTGEQMGGEWS